MSDKLLHLFFGQSPISLEAPDGSEKDSDIDFWKVAFRTGEWKLRPGPGGTKLKEPLKIFRDEAPKGHLSMSTIKAAFDASPPAKEHVTMPTVHADGTVSDSGFVRKLLIEDVKDEKGNVVESKLWAGCNVTDSAIKLKVEEKSLVGVSAGVLFNYERTEDGKKFPQVMSHLMITNSPWINGCGGFEKELPEGVMASDVAQADQDEVSLDSSIPVIDDGGVQQGGGDPKPKPSSGTVVWRPEDGFSFMRGKVQRALDSWRRSVLAAMSENKRAYDDFPYMRVDDVSHDGTSGKAMIRSGYGDDAVAWVASFKLDDDKDAIVEPFQNWTEAAQEWVAASEEQGGPQAKPAPSSGRAPYRPAGDGVELSDLRRAQLAREQRSGSVSTTTPTTNNGGRPVSKLSELLKGIELSDEQRALAREIEQDEANREREERERAEQRQKDAAMAFLSEMDGLGLGEKDSPGLRAVVRDIFMSDDGGTALMLSEHTPSGQRTQPVKTTAADIVKRVINALPRNQEGKVALSEQARALPGDKKPEVGDEANGNGSKDDDLTPQQKADALLSEDGFNFAAPVAGGGN